MNQKKETVIASFPFCSGTRWAGEVQVIEREQTFEDGSTKTFSDRRIKIGERYLSLPHRLDEVLDALELADDAGREHYKGLIERLNAGTSQRNGAEYRPQPQVEHYRRRHNGGRTDHEETDK